MERWSGARSTLTPDFGGAGLLAPRHRGEDDDGGGGLDGDDDDDERRWGWMVERWRKQERRGCKVAPVRRGIKMAFPKGCANLDKLYSGFSSSSSPPLPSLRHLCCFSSSLLTEQGMYAQEKRVGEGNVSFVGVFSPDSSPAAPRPSLSLVSVSRCLSATKPDK